MLASAGRSVVAELAPLIGRRTAKALSGFTMMFCFGQWGEWVAICAYAYAHQRRPGVGKQHVD